jgi:hypothetical protein
MIRKMKYRLLYLFMAAAIWPAASCKKDFEEINKDPNGFTTASDGSLFNAIVSSLRPGWNEQLYVNNEVLYSETQLASLSQVRWNNYSIGTEDIWSNYYSTLPNFRELEKRFAAMDTSVAEVKNMMAMVKVLLAFKTFKVTDLFGDIPFSGAGYGFLDATRLHPAFDSQDSIYHFLLRDLAWADAHIDPTAVTQEPFLTFARFDRLFSGDLARWRKLANSLRLRYAMRMSDKDAAGAASIVGDILLNARPAFGVDPFGFIVYDMNTECAALWPARLNYRNESKGWSFDQSKDLRLGTTMWHLLSANDSSDGSGIFDPRAYYFFETNFNNRWAAYPNVPPQGLAPDGGSPYNYQRDFAFAAKGQDCLYSPVNYYLARDMDYMPDVLITGAEVLFLRAEAYLKGVGVPADADKAGSAFIDGVNFSVSFWQDVMNQSRLPLGATFASNITVPSNVNFISVQNHLDYVLTGTLTATELYRQRWIDLFRQPQEAFALARRTGNTPREGSPSAVYRFPIPPNEVAYNQQNWYAAVGAGGDDFSRKVWWMH